MLLWTSWASKCARRTAGTAYTPRPRTAVHCAAIGGGGRSTALTLVRPFDTLCVEAIQATNRSRRPAPKPDGNGGDLHNGARRKAGLNTSRQDAGWRPFRAILADTAACWQACGSAQPGVYVPGLQRVRGTHRRASQCAQPLSARAAGCSWTAMRTRQEISHGADGAFGDSRECLRERTENPLGVSPSGVSVL
jgi:hypothetical protein